MMSITRAAIDLTVVETNRHAAQCSGKNSWKTCTEEVLAYFGFCIVIGINKLLYIYDYWSTDPCLNYAPIASRISQKRFMEIKSFMHL